MSVHQVHCVHPTVFVDEFGESTLFEVKFVGIGGSR